MRRGVVPVALAIVAAGCSSGYNAGVTHVGHAHLLADWKKWGAARALPDSAAPRTLAEVRAAVRRSRAQPVSMRLYRVRDSVAAPAVVVASFTPRSWLSRRSRRLLADLQNVVGRSGPYYVGLVDRRGRFVWETGRALTATGPAGGVYAPPEIDACQPVIHSRPALGPAPPRCLPD
jgi:hypothetical protein